jgi:hypothetical protein
METPQKRNSMLARGVSGMFSEEALRGSGKGALLGRRNSLVRSSSSKYTAALDAANTKEERKLAMDSLEDMRVSAKKAWSSSPIKIYYDNFIIFVGLISMFEFIHETYYTNERNKHYGQTPYLDMLRVIFTCIFGFDWSLELILADKKVDYLSR